MKVVYLVIIMIFLLIAVSYTKPVHAESSDPVQILNVQVQPNMIKVNNTFSLHMTILNNSTFPIYLTSGSCSPAFSVMFDAHAKQVYPNIACTAEAILQKVNPQSQVIISNANKPGVIYQAVQPGTVAVNITLPYFAKNQTVADYSNIYYSTSKSFQFQIRDVNFDSSGPPVPMPGTISPLKQFKSGIKAQDIKCNTGFILVLKQDYAPACIKEPSAIKLFLRGWIFGFADYQPVYFMKHNIHAEISVKYSPSNHGSMSSDLLDLYPRAYSKTNSNYPTDAVYANTNPDMISQNAETVVKYTIMAQNNTRGVYWLSLDNMCELVPIAVDVDKSNLKISDLQSPATAWKCPGSTMQYHVIGVSGVTVELVPIIN